jgi:hypothetical protein
MVSYMTDHDYTVLDNASVNRMVSCMTDDDDTVLDNASVNSQDGKLHDRPWRYSIR